MSFKFAFCIYVVRLCFLLFVWFYFIYLLFTLVFLYSRDLRLLFEIVGHGLPYLDLYLIRVEIHLRVLFIYNTRTHSRTRDFVRTVLLLYIYI